MALHCSQGLKGLRVRGGTNIHDALVEALRSRPTPGCVPIVLFLTDGLPTVGQTAEKAIREAATKANLHERRIFTFGVGVDVNTPLLDRLARRPVGAPLSPASALRLSAKALD